MAVNDKLKHTLIGAARVARSASLQVRDTAAPVLKEAARQVWSQLERRGGTATSESPPAPTATEAAEAAPSPADPAAEAPAAEAPAPAVSSEAPAAPTPAAVAKNIAPKPAAARPTPKRKPVKKAAPGAKLPVRRTADRPDSA